MYNGQHYDAIVSSDGKTMFPLGEEANNEIALSCAAAHKERREAELRTRVRKKIKCMGCNAILLPNEFQSHCSEVEHGDDFSYECEDVEVTEIVQNVTDD